jgi:OOP family OmpA-OmpF porin
MTPNLMQVLQYAKNNPNEPLTLTGNTDSMGSPAYNDALAMRRANAVKNFLVQNGVPASNVKVISLGASNPLVSNDTAAGRAINRRTEIQ